MTDRYEGTLLGLAAGDALGSTIEFRLPGSFDPIDDMVGGGHFKLKPGEWTDDTSMALCLAYSLIERNAFDPLDQMQRYVRWWREGYLSSTGRCIDIGDTTRAALALFEQTGDPYAGTTNPRGAGNGSVMRLAPVALFFRADPAQAIERAADSSRTTHGAPEAVDACRYLAALIVGALNGSSKDELLASAYWTRGPLTPRIDEIRRGSFAVKNPPEIRGTGYVVQCLEAALWAFHHARDFRHGALLAVNLGDDADTTGAVYGQLAGAYYGRSAMPAEWVERLVMRDVIEQAARGLQHASQSVRSAAAVTPRA